MAGCALAAVIWTATCFPEIYFRTISGPTGCCIMADPRPSAIHGIVRPARVFTRKSCVSATILSKAWAWILAINGDGLPDIYVSNIADKYALGESHFFGNARANRRHEKGHRAVCPRARNWVVAQRLGVGLQDGGFE